MIELENISSLLKSCLEKKHPKTQQPKPYSNANVWKKKIKPWLRNTWIVSFKVKRKPPRTQPKEEILEHPVSFMLLLFLTMTVRAIIILESSPCLQPGLEKLESVQIRCHSALHLTLTPVCLSLPLLFFKFEWPNLESVSAVKNNKGPNIYRNIWCTLLSQV